MEFLDLFSGIGGFRLGFEQAGHECVGHIEIDKYANLSYAAMHKPKESEFFGTDIRAVDPWDLPDADIYCGGFPCQSFSIAGKRGGFEDTRGTLFFEIARLVKERKPKMLLLENVKGLLSHDKGNTFETIIGTLGELGYFVEWQVLNSKAWVPQNRERVFIVGHLGTGSGREVFPIRQNDGEIVDIQGQSINCLTTRYEKGQATGSYVVESEQYAQRSDDLKFIGGIDTASKRIESGKKLSRNFKEGYRVYDSDGIACCQKTNGGGLGGNTGLYAVPVLTPDRAEKRQNGRRFKKDGEPAFTLTAQDRHGVMLKTTRTEDGKEVRKQYENGEINESRHNMTTLEPRDDDISNTISTVQKDNLLLDNFRIRRLTPKECFRLQGFPDEYFRRAESVNSNSQLYKQAGNAISVPVAFAIAKKLK